jgi:hypothetical protein
VSKLRAAVAPVVPAGCPLIDTAFGGYRFRLPLDGMLDIEMAHRAIHDAEAELAWSDRRGRQSCAHRQPDRLAGPSYSVPTVPGRRRSASDSSICVCMR